MIKKRPPDDPVYTKFNTIGFHSYKYDTVIQVFQNNSVNIAACMDPDIPKIQIEPSVEDRKGKIEFIFFSSIWCCVAKVYIHLVKLKSVL